MIYFRFLRNKILSVEILVYKKILYRFGRLIHMFVQTCYNKISFINTSEVRLDQIKILRSYVQDYVFMKDLMLDKLQYRILTFV